MSFARSVRLLLCAFVYLTIFPDAYANYWSRERIVGGQPAQNVNIPYIVSLINNGYHSCGGSIINERTVLTAAHCLVMTTARLLQVHAGTKSRSLSRGVLIPAEALHYHKQWRMTTMDNDIGVVRLARALSYSNAIQPIRLPQRNSSPRDGTYATVSGWGYMKMDGPEAKELNYAMVPIINQDTCNQLYAGAITPRMLCAGYAIGGIDACQMDSGGPLVVRQQLVGIVSWGVGCALPNKPGVYTRVSELRPWVEQLLAQQYNEII